MATDYHDLATHKKLFIYKISSYIFLYENIIRLLINIVILLDCLFQIIVLLYRQLYLFKITSAIPFEKQVSIHKKKNLLQKVKECCLRIMHFMFLFHIIVIYNKRLSMANHSCIFTLCESVRKSEYGFINTNSIIV